MTSVNEESGEYRDVTSETAFEGIERRAKRGVR